ncbi:MAG: hypothetical protein HY861_00895 [Chlamydiia bacterium]|nr:hypothetical protein [Chlamydiia bacterium]
MDKTTPSRTPADEASSRADLISKELEVNREEQILLTKRIRMMTESINDISSDDPQYSTLAAQIQMDKIEIDELKIRELSLLKNIN